MATIYIHVGRGQTGSYAIRQYLTAQRSRLRELGIHYLWADEEGRGLGHANLAKSFITHAPDIMKPAAEPEKIRDAAAEEIESCSAPVILISSENFSIADVSEVRRYFQSIAPKHLVKIILFVRSQDEVAESEYNQVVMRGVVSCSFTDYIGHKLGGCDYMEMASAWERYFGKENIVCRIYDGARRAVIEELLSSIGASAAGSIPRGSQPIGESVVNSSIGIRALTALRMLNQIDLTNRQTVYAEVMAGFAGNDLPALFFDAAEAREYRARFAAANRAFTERFLGRAQEDLGGRRYSDRRRDQIRQEIMKLGMAGSVCR